MAERAFHEVDPDGDCDLLVYPASDDQNWRERFIECSTPVEKPVEATGIDDSDSEISTAIDASLRDAFPPLQPTTDSMEGVSIAEEDDVPVSERLTMDVTDYERIKVSSGALRLSSSYYRKMFRLDMGEKRILESNGRITLTLEGHDPTAALHLMNIIHGRTRSVPASIDLPMLTKVAVLVDYLDCHEAVEHFTKMWIMDLEETIPNSYTSSLIQWIFIASVFEMSTILEGATLVAFLKAPGPFRTLGLPIRDSIKDKIDRKRENALQNLFSSLICLKIDYQTERKKCPEQREYECNAVRLGALMIACERNGFTLQDPFDLEGLSIQKVVKKLYNISDPIWGTPSDFHSKNYKAHKSCKLSEDVKEIIKAAENILLESQILESQISTNEG